MKCLLRCQGHEIIGYSSNISAETVYVQVANDDDACSLLVEGALVDVMFYPPAQIEPVRVATKVDWINPRDQDVGGRASVGCSLRILSTDSATTERLTHFLAQFRYTILFADESPEGAGLRAALDKDYRVLDCTLGSDALAILDHEEIAVLVCPLRFPDMEALALLAQATETLPHARFIVIVIAETDEMSEAEAFLNSGKILYWVRRPLNLTDFKQVMGRAVDAYALAIENQRLSRELERANQRLERENSYLRQRVTGSEGFEQLIGNSPRLREALAELARIGKTDATVHVHGETGTGKELVARALHHRGPRAKGPFVAQNCGGMTESLLQSTLFGYKKGAFTGADRDRPGVFQEAHRGTLFLDEVAELTPAMQAGLLRVLQQREVTPVGATRPEPVDVRVISATHKNLREEVAAGRFREDLYFRLVVITVRLPSLRERVGDISILAKHFLDLLCTRYGNDIPGFEPEAIQRLERYPWPGNVRELENEIERLVILGETGRKIAHELLSPHITDHSHSAARSAGDESFDPLGVMTRKGVGIDEFLFAIEREMVLSALAQSDQNKSRAADLLKIPRQTLNSRLKRLAF